MDQPFTDYLAVEFMRGYHGDKEHYENAFDGWLENLDIGQLIEYGDQAMRELNYSWLDDLMIGGY
jgi:hypothetical protein